MHRSTIVGFFVLIVLFSSGVSAEEGMYPINLLGNLDLRAKGLQLDARTLYNPDSVGLIDAVVKIGGCTGSFVSAEGLIITNHHCVFGYVQAASSKEHDYVTDGYLARNRTEELRASGATVKITESYRDVSHEITAALSDTLDAAARSVAVNEKIRTLVAEAEKRYPGKSAEVSEMIPGESYILFVSTLIRDVRVVYVPPRAIGEYGGEDDNWVWPRHTGDFSFVRAYVAPDGSPAAYSANNVPYHPRAILRVQPAGVREGDEVFILGYPGRTYRHRTSHYMAYEEQVRMPYVSRLYYWQIKTMEQFGAADRGIALKFDARIKSLANAAKNYAGKLLGMKRLHLTAKKAEEERRLQQYIDADPVRVRRFGGLLNDIGAVYKEMEHAAPSELVLDNLRPSSALLMVATTLRDVQEEIKNAGTAPDSAMVRKAMERLKGAVENSLKNYYQSADSMLLREMLLRAARLPATQRLALLDDQWDLTSDTTRAVDRYVARLYEKSAFADREEWTTLLNQSPDRIVEVHDPFLDLARAVAPAYNRLREVRQVRESRLSKLSAELLRVQKEYLKSDFIPDANSTLRFTYGHVRGYSPADGTYYAPITTLKGVLEKSTGREPFNPPQKLVQLYRNGRFGRYALPHENIVPVALLYDLDTTGGNSGSPLLNGRGELVGVNFDRAFEATINDYAWSEEYSRSIAVDIRYVLWVTGEIGGAGFLLNEMGVAVEQGTE
jgi:hypothetical protein